MQRMLSNDEAAAPKPKDLKVPEHLMCQISGDLMHEPILIQSGMTFEKEVIERYFKVQSDRY